MSFGHVSCPGFFFFLRGVGLIGTFGGSVGRAVVLLLVE